MAEGVQGESSSRQDDEGVPGKVWQVEGFVNYLGWFTEQVKLLRGITHVWTPVLALLVDSNQ